MESSRAFAFILRRFLEKVSKSHLCMRPVLAVQSEPIFRQAFKWEVCYFTLLHSVSEVSTRNCSSFVFVRPQTHTIDCCPSLRRCGSSGYTGQGASIAIRACVGCTCFSFNVECSMSHVKCTRLGFNVRHGVATSF